jgi:hypothetical protein
MASSGSRSRPMAGWTEKWPSVFHKRAVNFLRRWDTISFWRRTLLMKLVPYFSDFKETVKKKKYWNDWYLNSFIRSVTNPGIVSSKWAGVFLKRRTHKIMKFIKTSPSIRWLVANNLVCFSSSLVLILIYNARTKLSPFGRVAKFCKLLQQIWMHRFNPTLVNNPELLLWVVLRFITAHAPAPYSLVIRFFKWEFAFVFVHF